MELEEQLCGLELAKKLKELGVEQESLCSWVCSSLDNWWIAGHGYASGFGGEDVVSAFSVAELGEMIPNYITIKGQTAFLNSSKHPRAWCLWYENPRIGEDYGENCETSEANARAKILIYLIENKLIGEEQ